MKKNKAVSAVITAAFLLIAVNFSFSSALSQVSSPETAASAAHYKSASWSAEMYSRITSATWKSYDPFKKAIDINNIDYPLLNAAIYYSTNEMRVKNGLKEVLWAMELERSSWNYAKLMAEKNFFSHYDPSNSERKTPDSRGLLAGIANPHIAENIAETFALDYDGSAVYTLNKSKGQYSKRPNGVPIPMHTYQSFAVSVVDQWMHSPGHRANILSAKNVSMGCGAYYFFSSGSMPMASFKAVQNFQWFEPVKTKPAKDPDPASVR